jgi:hypothetical protein
MPDNSPELSHSGLGNQPQSFSLRIVAHFAGRVEVHGGARVRGVCGPMRQAAVIRISGPREIHPCRADLLRQNKGFRRTRTVVVTDFGIVEGERNFTRMEGTGAIIQYGCPPSINISVRGRGCRYSFTSRKSAG